MANYKNFYYSKYNQNFYHFDNYQFEINPNETVAELNTYDVKKQQEEIIKCTQSFSYFCHKYVKILHPTKGLIPFIMFTYQVKCKKRGEQKGPNFRSTTFATVVVVVVDDTLLQHGVKTTVDMLDHICVNSVSFVVVV